jgi:hypothetical protein
MFENNRGKIQTDFTGIPRNRNAQNPASEPKNVTRKAFLKPTIDSSFFPKKPSRSKITMGKTAKQIIARTR